MGIHFVCHLCSYALHVKDFQAGKRGKCPNCNGSFRIPFADASYSFALEDGPDNPSVMKVREAFQKESQSKKNSPSKTADLEMKPSDSVSITIESTSMGSNAVNGSSASASVSQAESAVLTETDPKALENLKSETIEMPDVLASAVDAKWFVRPPSGGQFGPASSALLMNWITESRVTADSFLWREGLAQWQIASQLVPELFSSQLPVPAMATSLNAILSADRSEAANTKLEMQLDAQPTIRSAAVLKKRMQKRRQQLTMVIVLASVSLILLSILIFVLVFQVGKSSQTGPVSSYPGCTLALQVWLSAPQLNA